MISHELKDRTLWIYISGKFTIDCFNDFQAAYEESDFDDIRIDFSEATHIDSGGLGMLLQLRTNMGENSDKIVLQGVSDNIERVFDVVNFDQLFTIV